jgi:superfamily II DNA/RNA helicase
VSHPTHRADARPNTGSDRAQPAPRRRSGSGSGSGTGSGAQSAGRSGGARAAAARGAGSRGAGSRGAGRPAGTPRSRQASPGGTGRPTVAPVRTLAPLPPATSFASAGLPEALTRQLARRDITVPFPVQAATLPDALAGHDVLGKAETGSGKTLGFGLPALARLMSGKRSPRRPRALILVPTRELAQQVSDVLAPLAQVVGLKVATVYGGASMGRQIEQLNRGADLMVATPGRLVDLLERHAVYLDSVEIAVLDEADHLCDLGFLPVVRRLLDLVPAGGQRMLFSATLDGDADQLVRQYLVDPVLVEVAPAERGTQRVTHVVHPVSRREDKPTAIAALVRDADRALVFVRTKHGADRLARQLAREGLTTGALHGGLAQNARTRALAAFAGGSLAVLVATDVAARGLHVDGIDLVVHADPPTESKVFAHRSGRTGRAGADGEVVTVVLPDEEADVRRMLAQVNVSAA